MQVRVGQRVSRAPWGGAGLARLSSSESYTTQSRRQLGRAAWRSGDTPRGAVTRSLSAVLRACPCPLSG